MGQTVGEGVARMKLSKAEWAAVIITAGIMLFWAGERLWQKTDDRPYVISGAHAPEVETPAPPKFYVPDSLVDINTAGVDELATLPGIGQAKAEAIVEYREANGPFAAPEDLMQVSGIGEATYRKLAVYITVRETGS